MAVRIQRHRADGAEIGALHGVPRLRPLPAPGPRATAAGAVGVEIVGATRSISGRVSANSSAPVAGQHHVLGMLHHRARQQDRVPDRGHAGDGAGAARVAFHDRGIEFVAALGIEHRALAGVEPAASPPAPRSAAATASSARAARLPAPRCRRRARDRGRRGSRDSSSALTARCDDHAGAAVDDQRGACCDSACAVMWRTRMRIRRRDAQRDRSARASMAT